MAVKAVIDIGTNSFKLLVMRNNGGAPEVLADRSEITRLGDGAARRGALSGEAMARGEAALAEMAAEARSLGADEIAVVATQALRAAGNAEDFKARVKASSGLEINVISGLDEARLSFRAALARVAEAGGAVDVFDVGGGSTEIVRGAGGVPRERVSIALGALSLHNEYFDRAGLVAADEVARAREAVRKALAASAPDAASLAGVPCVGIGGTVTTLGAVMLALDPYDPEKITGTKLPLAEIERQISLYASMTAEERKKIPGLDPRRAEIILAGACIVAELAIFARAAEVVMSDRGLRYGAMEEFFGI